MPARLKVNNNWRNLTKILLMRGTEWKNVVSGYLKVGSSWRLFFSSAITPSIASPVEISQSTNSVTKLITLTGKNYRWTNSTGLEYNFNRYAPNSFDSTLDTGIITNPTVSNTKTYLLIATDVLPNVTNTFEFAVTATNSTYNTFFISEAILDIEGVRNITGLLNTVIDYDFLQFEWGGGQYSNSFIYQYQTYNSGVEGTWSSQQVTTDNFAGLLDLDSNTTYRFRVKGITGTTVANQGYSGNWEYQTGTTIQAPTPQVITLPTINGSGFAFTPINGTSGTYVSGTFKSKTSYIGFTRDAVPFDLVNGSTYTPLGNIGSPPYNVKQVDASAPRVYFYYVDAVTGNDNLLYYFYSPQVISKIGQAIDDYTRTVTGGLGVMTPSINSFMNPNSYIYNVTSNGSLWSVNGSVASIPSAVSGSDPFNYPQQSMSLDGATNATVSASFPAGPDGLGLTFWSTGAGSWWASTVNRTASTTDKYVYYTLSTVCDAAIGTAGDNCRSETVITQVCTAGQGTINNNCGVVTTCPENGIGSQVTNCRTRTQDLCPNNGTGNFNSNCKSRSVSVCTDNGNGSLGNNCKSRSVTTCPDNGMGSSSSNCKTRSVTTCPANGTGSSVFNCGVRSVSSCPDNGTGNSTTNCKSRTVTTQTCPDNGIGSTSSNCKTRTLFLCPNNGQGSFVNNCKTRIVNGRTVYDLGTTQTVYDNFVSSSSTVYDSTVTTAVYDQSQTVTVYDNFSTQTVYDIAGTTTVYDSNVVQSIYDGNVDTYSGNVPTSTTIYYKYGCTVGPVTQYGGTLPTNCSNTSSTVTVYSTNLRTLNANGSTVSVVNTESIFSNEESPSTIGGMTVQTSGNTISTTVYSDTGRTSAITTKSYTPSNPTKSAPSGLSAFGIIKTPPGSSGGTQFDNLQIN